MSNVPLIPPPAAAADARSPSAFWATIESTLSVFFAFAVGFVVVLGGGVAAYMSFEERGLHAAAGERWVTPAAAAIALGELASLWWLKVGLEGTAGRSRIPQIALRQRRWPLALRPLFAAWWTAHLALAVAAMVLFEQAVSGERELWTSSFAFMALLLFGYFTISHTTHLYAMLTITALRRSERLVHAWWRKRFFIDLVAAGAALAISAGLRS